jgi:L-2-hydroxyglutarate oxidase LhgO
MLRQVGPESSSLDWDVAVIGAGVVGCATAAALARRGLTTLLVDSAPRVAEGTTSRSSGVIHSGLYYPPGSLKAQSCVRGQALLYAWAAAHGVWHKKTGKLVIARGEAEQAALAKLHENARASGARGIRLITGDAAADIEPAVRVDAALWCPETGVVDPVELTQSLRADAERHGAEVVLNCRVTGIASVPGGFRLDTTRGELSVARVVNAAGLYADEIAALAGAGQYRIHPVRGDWFRLRTPHRFRTLIYPVKNPAQPGLGVHLTLERDGSVKLGPDVEYVTAKDDFSRGEEKLDAFHAAAIRLLGSVDKSQLAYDGCGLRPKLRGPHDPAELDFVLQEDRPGFINLVGIESPGITAALDLADRVAALVG